jgi:hypothetical protein
MATELVAAHELAIEADWDDDAVWTRRLERDRRLARRRQTTKLAVVTRELLRRSLDAGALSFVLTGSTALDRRTPVSDVDYYVVGRRPRSPETDEEIDLYAVDLAGFRQRLDAGDDYLHWTLRFGLVLHDAGPIRWALGRTAREKLWPDPLRKATQARRALDLAAAILDTGDHDAAVEQARIGLSLAARWWLLREHEFPRARSDLPEQLRSTPLEWLGTALWGTIHEDPPDQALLEAVQRARDVLHSPD